MPTTSVRRRISLLRRSRGLLDQIFLQWRAGKLEKARMSGPASSSREADTAYNAYSIEVTTHGPCENGRYRAISAHWMLGQ